MSINLNFENSISHNFSEHLIRMQLTFELLRRKIKMKYKWFVKKQKKVFVFEQKRSGF